MTSAIHVRAATPADTEAISALNALVFGPGRFVRTAYRIRTGLELVSRYCKVCVKEDGTLVAAVRLAPVRIGSMDRALMLGPLAVAPEFAGQGYGRQLIAESLEHARRDGIRIVLLVGDEPYYGRLGFQLVPMGQIRLPGPVDPARLLAAELVPGALAEAKGLVSGDRAPADCASGDRHA